MKITADLDRVFVTSDHHWGHENIIKYTDRPFADVVHMDNELVSRWNEAVGPNDVVFHLGDFMLGGWPAAHRYFSRLTGYVKVLSYPWHHDRRWLADAEFDFRVELLPPMVVLEVPELSEGKYPLAITLCHYPVAEWDRKHYGAWHFHGHSHGNCQVIDRRLDVGVDSHDFRPWSLAEIAESFRARGWV